jgi:hypothetical protein
MPRDIPEERRSQNYVITVQISISSLNKLIKIRTACRNQIFSNHNNILKSLLYVRLSKDFSDVHEEMVAAGYLLVNLDNTA